MSRARGLIIAGVGLTAVTFAGAAKLLDSPSTGALPAPPAGLVGTTVHGTVDSDPPPIRVGPPAAAGQYPVDQVFVTDGQEVPAGQKLVQFDDSQLRPKVDQARGAVAEAEAAVEKAKAARGVQDAKLALQQHAVKSAEDVVARGEEAKQRGIDLFNKLMANAAKLVSEQPLTPDQVEQRRRDNPELFSADATLAMLKNQLEGERLKLAALRTAPIEADVKAAEAAAARARGVLAEAESAVASCLVKARVAGVVEKLEAAPGTTFGPTARDPLLLLVPAGPRVVRAEVDPEFAYRVADKRGAKVTVTDFTNTTLTYPGVVRLVNNIYLPKRSAGLVLDPPKTLECVIDLPDPAPAGKPPLRVNQPVRVIFP